MCLGKERDQIRGSFGLIAAPVPSDVESGKEKERERERAVLGTTRQ